MAKFAGEEGRFWLDLVAALAAVVAAVAAVLALVL